MSALTDAGTAGATAVDVHGLTLRVECDLPDVAEAVAARLAQLPAGRADGAELTVAYRVGIPPHAVPADARVVYESEHGRVSYSASADELHARYGTITMRCEPERGFAEIAVPTSATAETWVLSRPMLTLPLMETAKRRGLYPLHAACAAADGAGVLVTGPSGSGKSTLAIALARAGLDFVADDLVFVADAGARVLGFPDEVGAAAGLASTFPGLAARPRPGWPKARLAPTEIGAAGMASECRPSLLVLLTGERIGPAALVSATRDAAFMALLPTVLLTDPKSCAAHTTALGDLVDAARPLAARGGDPRGLATLIAQALGEHRNRPERPR